MTSRSRQVGHWLMTPAAPQQRSSWATATLVGVWACACVFYLWLERDLTFTQDEIRWLQIAGTDPTGDVLDPYNEHLIAFPLLAFKATLSIGGTAFLPFTLLQLGTLLATSALVYLLGRRALGAWLALAPATVILFLGGEWALQPLMVSQAVLCVAFGLGAYLLIDRGDRGGDIAASGLVLLSLASHSAAVAFAVGIAIKLAFESRRRLWVVGLPVVLYALWRLLISSQLGGSSSIDIANVPLLPLYVIDSIGVVAAAPFGNGALVRPGPGSSLFVNGFDWIQATKLAWLVAVELVAVGGLIWFLVRRKRISPSVLAAGAMLLVLWTAQGLVLAEGRFPAEERFVFTGTTLALVFLIEAFRGVSYRNFVVVGLLLLTVAGVLGNAYNFHQGRAAQVEYTRFAKAYMSAMELAGKQAEAEFNPATDAADLPEAVALFTSVRGHLALVSSAGSPTYQPSELLEQPEDVRAAVDQLLARLYTITPRRARIGPDEDCRWTTGAGAGGLRVPRHGARLRATAHMDLVLRRTAEEFAIPIGTLRPGETVSVRIPHDRLGVPWRMTLPAGVAIQRCPLEPKRLGSAAD